jgi:hypothetical protein
MDAPSVRTRPAAALAALLAGRLTEVVLETLPGTGPQVLRMVRRRFYPEALEVLAGWVRDRPTFPKVRDVRRLREHRGESLARFGRRFDVSAATVARWERAGLPGHGPARALFCRYWRRAGLPFP